MFNGDDDLLFGGQSLVLDFEDSSEDFSDVISPILSLVATATQKNIALKAQIDNLKIQWNEQLHTNHIKILQFLMRFSGIEQLNLIEQVFVGFYLPGDVLVYQLIEQLQPEQTQAATQMPLSELEKLNHENIKLEQTIQLFTSSILQSNFNACRLIPTTQTDTSNTSKGMQKTWQDSKSSSSSQPGVFTFIDETADIIAIYNKNKK